MVIDGETGTGKELVARAIHEEGPGARAVFVPVNCAVLGDELKSELLGHARGAFTGAAQDRKGLLEPSSGGTVFLDEVAELTPRAQAKLLRVLQDGEIRRLGENRIQRLDLRVVAATNRPLDAEAAAGRFRRNLLRRLSVLTLTAPPLRDRGPDIAGSLPANRPLREVGGVAVFRVAGRAGARVRLPGGRQAWGERQGAPAAARPWPARR